MSEKEVIKLDNVGVRYILQKERPRTLQEYFISLFKGGNHRKTTEEFWALRGINLTVRRGEALGIIGHNGAGKSTLLKVISGVIPPAEGKVEVRGNISPIIDIGAGFAPDLTGLENIYLGASVLGMSRREIQKRIPKILEFSELGEFINAPIRSYSTGMVARLGFSIAVEVDPDILIIDEVLAVGDQQFKRKCLKRISEFKERGVTILFVSHNITDVARLCDNILWLRQGRIHRYGEAREVAQEFFRQTGGPSRSGQRER